MLAMSFLLCAIGFFCTSSALAENLQIGGDFHIRNSNWPDHYLDVDSFTGVVELTTNPKNDKSKFTLWLPDSEAQQANPIYLLYSKWFDDKTIIITKVDLGGGVRYDATAVTVSGNAPISSIGLHIVKAPVESPVENRTLVMFGSPVYTSMYAWSGNSYDVRAREDEPGAKGYWYFDPPLPLEVQESLPAYEGPLCSWGCGEVSDEIALALCASPSSMLVAFAGLVLLLGVFS
jgi:hypothetical protein